MDRFPKKVLMKQPWDFKGQNKDIDVPKNKIVVPYESHALAHIECLLTGTEIAKSMTFLCDNSMANIQEVWAYGVLTGRLEPVYKEEPMK
ncbi:hypothetical protein P3S67_001562 [Capsicum chacoense]